MSDAEKFREWLYSIPYGKKQAVLEKVRETLLISKTTFTNMRIGRCRMTMAMKRDINKVALELSGYELYKIIAPD